MIRFDLRAILQCTVSSVYGDLVTRRTGQAVRTGVEERLTEPTGDVAVIDFTAVRCMDFSCADEIVGKLLLQHGRGRYFMLVGLDEGHMQAIQPVLERHGLAVVGQDRAGSLRLLGTIPDPARRAFGVVATAGTAAPSEVAARMTVTEDVAQAALDDLLDRRLIQQGDGGYQPIRCA
ncbi:MAG TPA: hypothetical protein VGA37_07470 [Gemmatimonadales bacterium]